MSNIVFIGSGNVATHLGKAFYNVGNNIVQVYSRNIENAKELSNVVKAIPITSLNEILLDADLYVICVTDDAIINILPYLKNVKGLVVHTSGSVDIEIFNTNIESYGVIYPLQTFSKQSKPVFNNIPFCIEANSDNNLLKIRKIVSSIAENISEINSEQRMYLHLAAVFVNNFTNSIYTLASEMLGNKAISFELLKPLILETAFKVQHINPIDAQTGPAKRNDFKIIEKHLHLLKNNEMYENLYKEFTKLIQIQQNKG